MWRQAEPFRRNLVKRFLVCLDNFEAASAAREPKDRGREGFWPPLPPNRTCGFPAYGSPVASFLIGGI